MRIQKIIQINTLFNGFIACLLIPSYALGALNKWEDEKGQVHYGDSVPSEYLHKEHSMLNEQGVTVRISEALKTDEELSELEKQKKLQMIENTKRMIEERKRLLRDRVLLDTFTTEADLYIARDARLEAIDSQIALAETLIKNDEIKLKRVKENIASIEKIGRKPPENMVKKVVFVTRQLENNTAYVEDRKNERARILKTFDQDVVRYRELMKNRQQLKNKQIE